MARGPHARQPVAGQLLAGAYSLEGIGVTGGWNTPTVWFLDLGPAGIHAVPGNPAHDAQLATWRESAMDVFQQVPIRVALVDGALIVSGG